MARRAGGGNLVPDAHLTALAVEYGVGVSSVDADVARVTGPRRTDPPA